MRFTHIRWRHRPAAHRADQRAARPSNPQPGASVQCLSPLPCICSYIVVRPDQEPDFDHRNRVMSSPAPARAAPGPANRLRALAALELLPAEPADRPDAALPDPVPPWRPETTWPRGPNEPENACHNKPLTCRRSCASQPCCGPPWRRPMPPPAAACLTSGRLLPIPHRAVLGDSLTVELSALDRAVLVRIQVPQPGDEPHAAASATFSCLLSQIGASGGFRRRLATGL